MDRRIQTGRRGEDIAAAYLVEKGYTLVARNWRCEAGELDMVLQDGNTLVFVEVRTRRSRRFGPAEESITPAKQSRLIELAHTYLQETSAGDCLWRIDVVAIHLDRGRLQVNHIQNAVGW